MKYEPSGQNLVSKWFNFIVFLTSFTIFSKGFLKRPGGSKLSNSEKSSLQVFRIYVKLLSDRPAGRSLIPLGLTTASVANESWLGFFGKSTYSALLLLLKGVESCCNAQWLLHFFFLAVLTWIRTRDMKTTLSQTLTDEGFLGSNNPIIGFAPHKSETPPLTDGLNSTPHQKIS